MRSVRMILLAGLTGVLTLIAGGCVGGSDKYPGEPVLKAERHSASGGLSYFDIVVGAGQEARAGDLVQVHYSGYLLDGTKFDSSRDRNEPLVFPLGVGRVIQGWDEGVPGMKVGGKRKLVVPSNLAYGDRGAGSQIPPNSRLVFDIELLSIQPH